MTSLVITLFLAGIVPVLMVARHLNNGRLSINSSRPIVIFGITYAIFFFLMPAIQVAVGGFEFTSDYSFEVGVRSWMYFSAFAAVVFAAYSFAVRRRRHPLGLDVARWRAVDKAQFAALFVGLSILVIFAFVTQYQKVTDLGYGVVVGDRSRLGSGAGYIMAPLAWPTIMGCVLSVEGARLLRTRAPGWRVHFAVSASFALLSVGAGLSIGSRSQSVIGVLLMISMGYYVAANGRLGSRGAIRLTGVVALVLVVGVLMGVIRENLMGAHEITTSTLQVDAEKTVLFRRSLKDIGTAENIFWLIENRDRWDWQMGGTFLAAVVGLVPRTFWADKPLGGGPVLRNMIYPGSYDLARAYNTSYTTGLPTEAFMNFGLWGIALVGIPYGLVLAWVDNLAAKIRSSTEFVAWSYASFTVAMGYHNGEFFGVTSWLIIGLTPLIILRWADRRKSRVAVERRSRYLSSAFSGSLQSPGLRRSGAHTSAGR